MEQIIHREKCNHENIKVVGHYLNGRPNKVNYFVKCLDCLKRTRDRNTPEKAINEWNEYKGSLYKGWRI